MKTEYIAGLPVDNITREDILQDVPKYFSAKKKMLITSVNPQITMEVENYPQIEDYIKRATHRMPDGVGVVKMSKLLGGNISQRVTGVDVMQDLLAYANQACQRIYLYGAKPEVVKQAAENIAKDYPNLIIAGFTDGYTKLSGEELTQKINASQPDYLFVALGAPKQELFLEENVDRLNASVFLDVGGTFDVLSGTVKRAPEIFIKLNIEWLYRSLKYNRPERLKQIVQYVLKSWRMRKHSQKMAQKTPDATKKTKKQG